MNREEAKYILRSYRANGGDAGDPQFADALELLKQDPELASWFAREQTVDAELSEKLQSLPVPPDLKNQLLAARKVVSLRAWWQQPIWLSAAAACLALALTLAVFLSRSAGPSFADYRSYVAQTTAKLDHLDIETGDLVKVRDWLGSHHAPENFAVPGKLNGKSSVGCRVFSWKGQKISLVCFELEDNKVAHLFVMDRSALAKLPNETPQFQTTADGVATASWADDRRVYVIAMEHGEQDLKRLLL